MDIALISLLEQSSNDESDAVGVDAIDHNSKDEEFEGRCGYENSARFTDVDARVADNLGPEHQKEEQEDDKVDELGSGDGSECSWNSYEHNF
jgi:hypothetical protein